ncbi:MAG: hypothetical protein KBF66_08190 [Rhodoferax sp.]|uniref:hypothetical protein n=1 Tax=Rhodoferax sp. TaxID=50421 RepID=UPI001B5FC7E3|nr:hypothetical protein [Rhodoferax sp.]MBP9905525.1 hypothetical protein [Rhodoferax sp.]
MKRARPISSVGLAVLLATSGVGAFGDTLAVAEQRQRIADTRAQQAQLRQEAEKACYARFAVTDCLRELRAQQRSVLNDLRRQEIILNDMERQSRALQALQRAESKLADPADAYPAPASPGQSPLR